MAIDQTHRKLLENLKESNLNFLLKITPFSTQISLKNSYVKRYHHHDFYEPEPASETHETEVILDQEKKVTGLEAKNIGLGIENEHLQAEIIKL